MSSSVSWVAAAHIKLSCDTICVCHTAMAISGTYLVIAVYVLGARLLKFARPLHTCPVIALALTEKASSLRLQLKKIAQLIDMFANEAVDVLGVVDTVADSALIQTRDGKDVSANICIPDLLCAWGWLALLFQQEGGPRQE